MSTGAALVERFVGRHPIGRHCPRCGEDCWRVGITDLAYSFEICACDQVEYEHCIETIWHRSCLAEELVKAGTAEATILEIRRAVIETRIDNPYRGRSGAHASTFVKGYVQAEDRLRRVLDRRE